MAPTRTRQAPGRTCPDWVPDRVRTYLDHVEGGQSIRALARARGLHASTVLRQVRRTEALRDDPLTDAALTRLGRARAPAPATAQELPTTSRQDNVSMTHEPMPQDQDEARLEADTLHVLKTLSTPQAELVITEKLVDAMLVLNPTEGSPAHLGTTTRDMAEMLALRELIAGRQGRALTRYRITSAGRAELIRLTAQVESRRASHAGKAEDAGAAVEGLFGHAGADRKSAAARRRSAGAESPLMVLSRRKAPDGGPFLGPEEVAAGLRFRTGFELARMDPAVTRDWERLVGGRITGGGTGGFAADSGPAARRLDATRSLEAAIRRLGPELAEVTILALCEEQGMESVEQKLGYSARAGKNILKIALQMLVRHYRDTGSRDYDLIG